MKRISSVLAAILALALLCGVFALPAGAAIDTTGFAAEVVSLTNVKRDAAGKLPLQSSKNALHQAAQLRAQEIVVKFDHERPDGTMPDTALAHFGITGYTAAAENIAKVPVSYTPTQLVDGWMDSAGHRKNILGENSNFNFIGVGVFESEGYLYCVQLFINDGTVSTSPDAGKKPGGGSGSGDEKGILGTNPKYNQWYHYILFFLCFGFIWMWF